MTGLATTAGPDAARAPDIWFRAAANVLAKPAGPDQPERAAALLARHYGLSGTLTPLSSEVEQTTELSLPDGRRLILKTSDRAEAVDSFLFQSATLSGLHDAAGVNAPQVLRTASGALMFRDGSVCGYLQTRLDGQPLHKAQPTQALAFQTGRALARLGLGLARIDTPAARRPMLWNIRCWPHLMEFAQYLPHDPRAEHVRAAMSDYVKTIAPQIADLDWQVTHNDPSPHNMLVTGSQTGFIDFGDGGWNPRVQDLAIAAGHLVTDPAQPLGGAAPLVAGYASMRPLSALEIRLLVGLMRARQSALILINAWRSHLFPAEADYINKNVARVARGLAILAPLDTAAAEAAVSAAMSLPPPAPQPTEAKAHDH